MKSQIRNPAISQASNSNHTQRPQFRNHIHHHPTSPTLRMRALFRQSLLTAEGGVLHYETSEETMNSKLELKAHTWIAGASLVAQPVKNPPAIQETQVPSLR